jgi:hypothetical protein
MDFRQVGRVADNLYLAIFRSLWTSGTEGATAKRSRSLDVLGEWLGGHSGTLKNKMIPALRVVGCYIAVRSVALFRYARGAGGVIDRFPFLVRDSLARRCTAFPKVRIAYDDIWTCGHRYDLATLRRSTESPSLIFFKGWEFVPEGRHGRAS